MGTNGSTLGFASERTGDSVNGVRCVVCAMVVVVAAAEMVVVSRNTVNACAMAM